MLMNSTMLEQSRPEEHWITNAPQNQYENIRFCLSEAGLLDEAVFRKAYDIAGNELSDHFGVYLASEPVREGETASGVNLMFNAYVLLKEKLQQLYMEKGLIDEAYDRAKLSIIPKENDFYDAR